MRRQLLLSISLLLLAGPAAARETPATGSEGASPQPIAKRQFIRVEAAFDRGHLVELLLRCPDKSEAMISFSKIEEVYCSPSTCGANVRLVASQACGGTSALFSAR